MTAANEYARPDPPGDSAVWRWRFHRLVASGYPEPMAAGMAGEESLDLELACRLVSEANCPPEVAARIAV